MRRKARRNRWVSGCSSTAAGRSPRIRTGNTITGVRNAPRGADVADDPDDPARLIKALQSTGPGCRWLLDRWAELRARLEAGECWQSPEKLKAIRLLGHQPLDAALVRDVRDVFQATYVIDPHHSDAFYELRCDLDDEARKQQLKRLNGPAAVAERPADAAAARALLLALVDRETGRLEPLAEAHRHQEKPPAPVQLSSASIDGNPEGERLRRYALACDRATRSIAASIAKFRKDFAIPESDPFETADAPYAPVTGQANGYRQNEPTAAEWQDRQNEPTAGAPDTVYDVDAAYREAMAAAMALIRNPAAGPQGINMDRLEQAIVANAREALRIEDLDNEDMGKTYPRPQDQSPADLANSDYESAHAETGLRQNEPTDDGHDRQNEATEGFDTAQQNEATDDCGRPLDKTNPPTPGRLAKTNPPTASTPLNKTNPLTTTTNSKTKPNSTLKSSKQNASIDARLRDCRANDWSGFRCWSSSQAPRNRRSDGRRSPAIITNTAETEGRAIR